MDVDDDAYHRPGTGYASTDEFLPTETPMDNGADTTEEAEAPAKKKKKLEKAAKPLMRDEIEAARDISCCPQGGSAAATKLVMHTSGSYKDEEDDALLAGKQGDKGIAGAKGKGKFKAKAQHEEWAYDIEEEAEKEAAMRMPAGKPKVTARQAPDGNLKHRADRNTEGSEGSSKRYDTFSL